MRVLVVAKRQYMGQDLLDDRFGRYREIPLSLARRGHDVQGLTLSYRPKGGERVVDKDEATGVSVLWDSVDLGRTVLPGLARFAGKLRATVSEFRPDIIWTGSDSVYGVFTHWVVGPTPFIFDFYDDYETFALSRLPGSVALHRRMVRSADGVTSFSEAMTEKVVGMIGRRGPTRTLLTGVDKSLFSRVDRSEARACLGLRDEASLVGLAGALVRRSGLHTLWKAAEVLAGSGIQFVVAGVRDSSGDVPSRPYIHDLGVIAQDRVPLLLSALDVGVVLAREGEAGRIGFPHKAFEMLACGLPIVASARGAMTSLLADCSQCLFDPDDVSDFVRAVEFQMENKILPPRPVPGWDDIAASLEKLMTDVTPR